MGDLYVGMDLHSKNTFVGILEKGSMRRVYEKRFSNDLPVILGALEPFRCDLKGITVESTYNWYWLVDGLMDAGYDCVHLANPSAIQQYNGLKYADDRHDAFWLARLLSLGILPEGYIYPKEDRPIRDLLRKRSFLVRQRVAHMNSLMSMIERNTGNRPSANAIRKLKPEYMDRIFEEEHLALIARTSVNALMALLADIRNIEKVARKAVKTRKPFEYLHTVPGIADILALTIMLEAGEISRFPNVGSFSSYCRWEDLQRQEQGQGKHEEWEQISILGVC